MIERGVQSPNLELLVRITSALEVDAGALITGTAASAYGSKKRQVTVRDFIAALVENENEKPVGRHAPEYE